MRRRAASEIAAAALLLCASVAAVTNLREETPTTFDGRGFIYLDLSSDALGIYGNSDTISLMYRTRQRSAFLIYAGSARQPPQGLDRRDFIALSLRNGSLFLDMSVNRVGRNVTIRPSQPDQFSDSRWHRLLVKRNYEKVNVIFDDMVIKMLTIKQPAQLISRTLYLGGHRSVLHQYAGIEFFKGCMREARVISEDATFDLLRYGRLGQHGVRTSDMPVGAFDGCSDPHSAEPVRFRAPGGHLVVRRDAGGPWSSIGGTVTRLAFQFATNEPDALLLYIAGESGDFLAFELRGGELHFLSDAGAGASQRQVTDLRNRLSDSDFNSVSFSVNDADSSQSVTLNSNWTVRLDQDPQRAFHRLDLGARLYLGGLPATKRFTTPPELQAAALNYGFVGLLAGLSVNGEGVDLVQLVLAGRTAGPPGLIDVPAPPWLLRRRHLCDSRPCGNGGVCREGWDRFVCDCTLTSFTGETCSDKARVLKFDGNGWLRVRFAAPLRTQAEDLVLRLRTNTSDGILLATVDRKSASNDSMRLLLRRGLLACSVNYGTGTKILEAASHRLDDGQWHTIVVRRRDTTLELKLDGKPKFATSLKSMGLAKTLAVNAIYVGTATLLGSRNLIFNLHLLITQCACETSLIFFKSRRYQYWLSLYVPAVLSAYSIYSIYYSIFSLSRTDEFRAQCASFEAPPHPQV
ncbi:hypothetical protein BOX15_Mlig002077g3 [Macrostomum lignano]|uniref:Laminin G domain-containing protein n=1 Tax=Macrostomum lignano TaxID=282301 RepID=A0A267GMS1_9PLAT|nr:hypothetical protein BOX15_Mlig002077g3 [Macrostomum lignano]